VDIACHGRVHDYRYVWRPCSRVATNESHDETGLNICGKPLTHLPLKGSEKSKKKKQSKSEIKILLVQHPLLKLVDAYEEVALKDK